MCAKLREIKEGLRHRMHRPIPETGKWLAQIVAGYFAYHAVPTNSPALSAFRYHVLVLWHQQLCRRSQRARPAFVHRRGSCLDRCWRPFSERDAHTDAGDAKSRGGKTRIFGEVADRILL